MSWCRQKGVVKEQRFDGGRKCAPKCDPRLFHKEPLKEFEMKLPPQSLQHPGFCRDGAFRRPMQVLRRKQTGKESKWKWKEHGRTN